jgi:large subunit ribosomal protein L1
MKKSKRYRELEKQIEARDYPLKEAIERTKELANAKFDESIDISIKLNIDPKKTDQFVRGVSNLPHGTGKTKRILVLTKGEKEKEAKDAGADLVGFEEHIENIKKGWSDIDVIIATPDVMSDVGKLGRILGPKGLMPSPKAGTVTFDVGTQVELLKKGKVEFKTDKTGCIHVAVGRASFDVKKLEENIVTILDDIIRAKPASVKGQFFKSLFLSSTQGPGVKLDDKQIVSDLRKGGV